MKILIAENGSTLSKSIRKVVKAIPGLKFIDEVSEGTEAFAKMSYINYDFVVLDANLQGMTGIEILEETKGNGNKTRTLIYSTLPNQNHARESFRLGASGYLTAMSAEEVLKMAVMQNALPQQEEVNDELPENDGNMAQMMVTLKNSGSEMINCALTVHVG